MDKMSSSADLESGVCDVCEFRNSHESNSEWRLRERFLVANLGKFPQDRLMCLSMCYLNCKLYGCRYPLPLMEQLKELEKDMREGDSVLDSLSEKKQVRSVKADVYPNLEKNPVSAKGSKGTSKFAAPGRTVGSESGNPPKVSSMGGGGLKNQINFVAASSLKSEKTFVKALNSTESGDDASNVELADSSKPSECYPAKPASRIDIVQLGSYDRHSPEMTSNAQRSEAVHTSSSRSSQFVSGGNQIQRQDPSHPQLQQSLQVSEQKTDLTKFHDLRQYLSGSKTSRKNIVQLLNEAVAKLNMVISFNITASKTTVGYVCDLKIDCVEVAQGHGVNKKAAKYDAFIKVDEKLRSMYSKIATANPDKCALEVSGKPFSGHSQWYNISSNQSRSKTLQATKTRERTLSNFIILEAECTPSAMVILQKSAEFNKMRLNYKLERDKNGVYWCVVSIEQHLIAICSDSSCVNLKLLVAKKALEILRKCCWTMKVKKGVTECTEVSRIEVMGEMKKNEFISDSNIGNKLLRKMGWTGGGVGKEGNKGILEPIQVMQLVDRHGLGMEIDGVSNDFHIRIRDLLLNYLISDKDDDLMFSPEFSKGERAVIHAESRKHALKSHSRGKGDNRYLVISRNRSVRELFSYVMNHGGKTNKYELILPSHPYYHD